MVGLISIFLVTNDVPHFFLCLFACHIFFGDMLVQSLAHFKNCFFFLLSFEISLYIMYTSPLSDICVAVILSQSMVWPFNL